jgi:hypothetical protein
VSRTPARITQADAARAIRAGKAAGAASVELLPNGVIRINLVGEKRPIEIDDDVQVVL